MTVPAAELGLILSAPFMPREFADAGDSVTLQTEHGDVLATLGTWEGRRVAFLRRGTPGQVIPAHRVRYRALIAACLGLGVQRILSTAVVGSLSTDLTPGTIVIIDQFLDFTRQRPLTVFDGDGYAHVDMTEPYCPELRAALIAAAAANGETALERQGCYVGVEGPRYETAAEIRMFARLGGDVIGMTNVPEVILSREREICYGTLAIVSNLGAGLTARPVIAQEHVDMMVDYAGRVLRLLRATLSRIPAERRCACLTLAHSMMREPATAET